MYVRTNVRTYVCMYVGKYVRVCMHVYMCMYTHTYTHTYVYIYRYTSIYICTHIIILYIYIHTSARYVDTCYGLHASFSLSSLVHFFFHAPFDPETERERERREKRERESERERERARERERESEVCSGRRRTHRRLFSLFSSGRRVMHDVQATGCASSVHSAINYVYMIPHVTTSTASTSCLHTAQRQRKLARR